MPKLTNTRQSLSQRGFTLLETLIALVVLSIGLLGVAKLVTGAVHANDSGYMRGQATQLAHEILDEMRANRPGAQFYGGAGALVDCSTVSCNAQTLAGLDTYNWLATVKATLPGGNGIIVPSAGVGGEAATIIVQWDDSEAQWAFGTAPSTTPGLMQVTLESVL
ncbi:MAG TPA: type IV pilus modification protein PilV [Steroidobacteraceae bacterium]|nr:type IV pilus modification protein PilV [Steroidobacteraceae bacterium]